MEDGNSEMGRKIGLLDVLRCFAFFVGVELLESLGDRVGDPRRVTAAAFDDRLDDECFEGGHVNDHNGRGLAVDVPGQRSFLAVPDTGACDG